MYKGGGKREANASDRFSVSLGFCRLRQVAQNKASVVSVGSPDCASRVRGRKKKRLAILKEKDGGGMATKKKG